MTKIDAIKEHIRLLEQFWERKYNPLHYAYGFIRIFMYSQEKIERASAGMRVYIDKHGTASKLNAKF